METDDGYERDGWRSAPDNPQWANELCGACRKDLFDQGFRAFCVSTGRLRHPIKPAPGKGPCKQTLCLDRPGIEH
jgi:hypothetical protein